MSLGHGAKIVTDGLKFAYDMGSKQSWKGKPTTNLVNQPTTAFSNWSGFTGTSTLRTTRQGRNRVHLIGTASGGVQWYNTGGQKVVTPSTEYTVSATIKYDGTTPHPNLFYIRQYNSSGSQTSENGKFSTSYMTPLGDGWYRAYRTFTTDSTAVRALVQGYQYTAPCNIQIQDVQLELGNINSPYVDGTRSNTEAIIDWAGNNTVTANSLIYASDNTFKFDGTVQDNYCTITPSSTLSALKGSNNITVETWVKYSSYSGGAQSYSVITCWGSPWVWLLENPSNKLRFRITAGGSDVNIVDPDVHPLNTWLHVVGTYDGSSKKIYVNGVLKNSSAQTGALGSPGGTPKIGTYQGTNYNMSGNIDSVKIYNKALTASEIKQNFNALRGRFGI